MTRYSIQELVRKDLLWHEKSHADFYSGRAAILDAYEEALGLCCWLRKVIEELSLGQELTHDEVPEYGA